MKLLQSTKINIKTQEVLEEPYLWYENDPIGPNGYNIWYEGDWISVETFNSPKFAIGLLIDRCYLMQTYFNNTIKTLGEIYANKL